jgi:hypothetical protein
MRLNSLERLKFIFDAEIAPATPIEIPIVIPKVIKEKVSTALL